MVLPRDGEKKLSEEKERTYFSEGPEPGWIPNRLMSARTYGM
jgi:hypothetical protein